MSSILDLFTQSNIPSALLFIFLTATIGTLISKIKIFNVRLGIAGVLFSGLAIAHFGVIVDTEILHFVRELGLLLFVFSIGLEIGPRFLTSLKNNGLKLNTLATLIVFLGLGIAILVKYIFNLDPMVAVGLLCGAVTNTPGLGAAQQLATTLPETNDINLMSTSYAIAYPFGIIGIIITMIIIKKIFGISVDDEYKNYKRSMSNADKKIEAISIVVSNKNIFGKTIGYINDNTNGIVISRIKRGDEIIPASDDFVVESNDLLVGVGEHGSIDKINILIGEVSMNTAIPIEGNIAMKDVIVTNRSIAGKSIGEIGIYRRYPARITRIFRGEFEFLPTVNSVVEFGDTVRIVGKKSVLDEIADQLGNSRKQLDLPNVLPIFMGIVLGIIVGSIPIYVPGLSIPAKLGLAGGPLIVAILIGNVGRIKKIDFYVARGANFMLREIGIVLFLAAVGLSSGGGFVEALVNGGYKWALYGVLITFIPIFIVGIIARLLKINYLMICGLLSGAMTDPPALEYANSLVSSNAQSITYATVYPLVMFLRIVTAQVMLLVII